MKKENKKISGLLLVGVLIIALLLSTVEIQPSVSGEIKITNNQQPNIISPKTQYTNILEPLLSKTIAPPWILLHRNVNMYHSKIFYSYRELSSFLNALRQHSENK